MSFQLFQLLSNLLTFVPFSDFSFTILKNVNGVFFTLWLLVSISLACTAAIKLIYLVLNLSVLSLLVVLLWMVSTEINIIFLVYILAFVGAVVMLFLSVVLMLPASVFTQKSQNLLILLLVNSTFDPAAFINTLLLALPDMLMLPCIIVLIDYLFIQPRQNMSSSYYKWLRREIYMRESQHRNYPHYSLNALNVISHYVNVLDVLSAPRLEKLQNNYRVIRNDAIYYINAAVGPFFTLGYYWNESKNYKYSLFKIFPIVYSFKNTMQPIISYLKCSAIASLVIFLSGLLSFVIINSILLMFKYVYKSGRFKSVDVLMQTITKASIFLTACPPIYTVNVYYPSLNNIKLMSYQDNLTAIKNVLYLEAPLLLIVSVTGLLVSLIGTAVLSRPSLIKKTNAVVKFENIGLLGLYNINQIQMFDFEVNIDSVITMSLFFCMVSQIQNNSFKSVFDFTKIIYPAPIGIINPLTFLPNPAAINRTCYWISKWNTPQMVNLHGSATTPGSQMQIPLLSPHLIRHKPWYDPYLVKPAYRGGHSIGSSIDTFTDVVEFNNYQDWNGGLLLVLNNLI